MNPDDKRLISWALRAYAEACERSPLVQFMPKGQSRDAKRARELADQFCPCRWEPTIVASISTREDEVKIMQNGACIGHIVNLEKP